MPSVAKPPERRQRRRNPAQRDARTVNLEVLPQKIRETPKPPRGLLKPVKDGWNTLWESRLADLIEDTDLPALRRLFTIYDERERSYRAVRDAGRLATGSTGQVVMHPLIAYIGTLDKEARALEEAFGLTPKGRLKLGITFGEASKSLADMNERLRQQVEEADDDDPRFD